MHYVTATQIINGGAEQPATIVQPVLRPAHHLALLQVVLLQAAHQVHHLAHLAVHPLQVLPQVGIALHVFKPDHNAVMKTNITVVLVQPSPIVINLQKTYA